MSEHNVEGCQGRWIDVGTLDDPLKQLCSGCRASRRKPIDDGQVVEVLDAAAHRHIDGLTRLKRDLESDALADDTMARLYERRVERLMFFALGLSCGVMLGVFLMKIGAL